MKNFTLLLLGFMLIANATLQAQNWVNGGNTLTANGTLGTNSNHSLLFETYNTERGRITNTGLWGIGTGTIALTSRFNINSATGQDPLRIMVNGNNKLVVHRYGGMSVGSGSNPPANGLYVAGRASIGTATSYPSTQLHVELNSDFGWGITGQGAFTGVRGDGNTFGVFGGSRSGIGVEGYSELDGYGGRFYSEYGTALIASTYMGEFVGIFEGSVSADGYYSSSDKNLKKNIQEVDNALSIINQLKPKHYEFKDDGKYASLKLPRGNHYGLLAQDVEEVLPNLVKESAHDIRDHKSIAAIKPSVDSESASSRINNEPKEKVSIKAVNYTELIPIVIKGMQEQQQTIQLLQQENNFLKERLTKLEAALGTNGYKGGIMGTNLQQNFPNPFRGTTTFTYSIPKGGSGKILVYDASGKLVKTLAASDAGRIQMDATGLSAGTYVYSLLVNGELIDSKQLVVAK